MLKQILYPLCLIILSLLTLTACDHQVTTATAVDHDIEQEASSANKLIDIAGRANIQQDEEGGVTQIAEQAKPYVGRYHTQISCRDKIVYCDEGNADLILNLLPNGMAYRAIIYFGEVSLLSNKQYRQDRWFYDEQQHEVVVERDNGMQLFFDIDTSGRLILNAEKVLTATAINRNYFAQPDHPKPKRNYILVKE